MKVSIADREYVAERIVNCEERIQIIEESSKLIPKGVDDDWAFVNLGYADKLLSLRKELEKWMNHESSKFR
jgi:hypothetical protein